jgi:hypothetical protein
MEQYVTVVDRAYETSGSDPPGKPVNGNKLYVEVRKSIDGFKRAGEKHGAVGPVPTLPTPDYVIGAQCAFVRRLLTPPISVWSLEMARCGLANVWQYFNISRPTMTAAVKWTVVTSVSAREVDFVLPRLAPRRKNKDAPTRRFLRALCRLSQNPTCIQFPHFLITVKLSCVWLSVDSSLNLLLFGSCPTEGFKLEQMNSNVMVKVAQASCKESHTRFTRRAYLSLSSKWSGDCRKETRC